MVFSQKVNLSIRQLLIIATLIGMILVALFNMQSVRADSDTKHVKGDFTLQFRFPGSPECGTWQGPCLTGTATGDLSGDVLIRVNNSYQVSGSARTVSVSNADITITRPDGQVFGGAAGSLDRASGEFHNVTSWVGGTGAYAQATGFVRVDGFDDPSGVEHSSYEGTLVLPKQ